MKARNVKLVVEYDGTDFHGWQYQPERRTVQAEVESAFSQLTQETVQVFAAGRTDAGVHALGQVINFFTGSRLPVETFVRGGNALLPADIRVLNGEEADAGFNARFSAKSREYRYVIRQRPSAIDRRYVWLVETPLDVDAMHAAVVDMRGEIDFKSFCQAGAEVEHHRCFVHRAEWRRSEDFIIFEICANRFLHNMVRILVGTSVEIGRGVWPPDYLRQIVDAHDRRDAGPTVPARGLFLMNVTY